jgi:MFS family permease
VLAVYYVQTLHLNPFELVLVGTVAEATIFLFEVPTGVIADTFSRRASVIAGFALQGVALVLTGLVPSFAFALVAAVILAVGLAAYILAQLARRITQPLFMTWLNRNIEDSSVRATVISMTNQSDAIGQFAGGPAIGVVGALASLRAALTASGLLLAPAVALYARAVRHRGKEPELEHLPEPAA